jgi:hypothetical protein
MIKFMFVPRPLYVWKWGPLYDEMRGWFFSVGAAFVAPHVAMATYCVPVQYLHPPFWRNSFQEEVLYKYLFFFVLGQRRTDLPVYILSRVRGSVTNNNGFWIG